MEYNGQTDGRAYEINIMWLWHCVSFKKLHCVSFFALCVFFLHCVSFFCTVWLFCSVWLFYGCDIVCMSFKKLHCVSFLCIVCLFLLGKKPHDAEKRPTVHLLRLDMSMEVLTLCGFFSKIMDISMDMSMIFSKIMDRSMGAFTLCVFFLKSGKL